MNRKILSILVKLGVALLLSTPSSGRADTASPGLIQPTDLVYQGAFRLPDAAGGCDWTYSGHAMTYYPGGDPDGPDDGHPGSIFAVGNDAECQHVSEISIPAPVVSPGKNPSELNTATTLQHFNDIRSGLFGEHQNLTLPRVGLEYLPAQGPQKTDKLHFCWAQHIQDFEPSHGWCELDLSNPRSAGPWKFGSYTNYATNDYLFEIPKQWADVNAPGQYLASGRAREGPWSGRGPALFAYAPWKDGNPPAANSTLKTLTPLLLYGTQTPGTPEIVSDDSMAMKGYQESDHWFAGAWLTAGTRAAVVLVGTKALGKSWYGFANGIVWPYDCADRSPPTCPEYPPWPYDNRGFWADGYAAQMIFFDPADLAAVASGSKPTHEPQPYATLDFSNRLFDPRIHVKRYKRDLVAATCFDRERGLIYSFERQADEEKGLVHVWKIELPTGQP
jgi:hypothetical protein